jgi:hypothetical protein
MRPVFILLFTALLLVPSHTGLSRQEALSAGKAVPSQSLQLNNQRIPGEHGNGQKADARAITLLNNLPLYFVENKGQVDSQVRYYTKTKNGTVYFTGSEVVYQFLLPDEENGSPHEKPFTPDSRTSPGKTFPNQASTIREETIRVSFVGANEKARLEGKEEREANFSYFHGSDPQKWISGAPSFQRVVYRDLYPGIDLVISGREGRMKNEYFVKPGADPTAIRAKYDGVKALRVNEKGQLEIQASSGVLIEDVPLSYQIIDGKKRAVATRYRIDADRTVQFQVKGYRRDTELIIDPLIYSTFLGGNADEGTDTPWRIAVDGSGNTYVTGTTQSSNFPTLNAYDATHNGNRDVFVAKLNATGNALFYATYLGGGSNDRGYGLAIDGSGNACVTGSTESSAFPTTSGAYDTSYNTGSDVFVTVLNAAGNALLYSTFLGGTNWEIGYDAALDIYGDVYVSGVTASTNFPWTADTYDNTYNGGSQDVFVAMFNPTLSMLSISTFLGGSGADRANGLAIDGSRAIYVTGFTDSSNFPTTAGAFDTSHNGNYDVFVTKLNQFGMDLHYSTFLGGTGDDRGAAIALDAGKNAYVTGTTLSSGFPITAGAYDNTNTGGYRDFFITKVHSSGGSLVYSTYLGGADDDYGYGIAVDGNGNAYVVGITESSDFPTSSNAHDQTYNGGSSDAAVTKLNASGNELLYSTFLGGGSQDWGVAIAIDGSQNVTAAGYTSSSDFPTTAGAYDTTNNGGGDVFITKLPTTFPDIRQPIAAISWGNYNVGSYSLKTTSIYNDGEGPLTVNSVTRTSGSTEFTFMGPDVPFDIGAGSFSNITLQFAPTSGGAKSAVFTVNSNDPDEPDATFDVSGTGLIPETISTPNTPSGTSGGYTHVDYTYATGGSTSNLGHDVQYLLDWGDGTDSGWLAVGTTSAQKSWSSAALYAVKAKARCATHTGVESSWSSSFSVNIEVREYDNSPSWYQVLPECIWAAATGGGTWVSEVQITDITGGSVVSVYFDYGGGNRRGPFTLWTAPGANQNIKYLNILSAMDALDTETFTYYGKVGAVEFSTQDVSHKIHVVARTLNGNYSKTFPGLNNVDSNAAEGAWRMILQNLVNNVTYRSSCGFFNPTTASVTVEFRLVDENGATIGSPFSRTFVEHDFQSFSPFNQAGVPYPSYSYENAVLWVTPTSGSGRVMVYGATANNTSNDPAAHIGVQYQGDSDNAPSNYQVVPECIWAVATGGGTWISEVQITDITGGSNVSVYFDYGGGARRGPFTIWTSGGANHNIRFANILASIDAADADAFTYYGRVGAVEFMTQDASHKIQVLARTLNGNYSKTLPGMNLTDSNTANTWRRMMLQNFVNSATYRSNCGIFNPTADPVTVEFRLIDWMGDTIGSAFSRTLVGHDFQSFSPFNQAGVPYPSYSNDNAVLWITPTSGSGKVMVYGATANNASNDPAAHIGVQYQ